MTHHTDYMIRDVLPKAYTMSLAPSSSHHVYVIEEWLEDNGYQIDRTYNPSNLSTIGGNFIYVQGVDNPLKWCNDVAILQSKRWIK